MKREIVVQPASSSWAKKQLWQWNI